MVPSAAAPPPKDARERSNTAVGSSWPISENKLSIPIANTFRVSPNDPN